MACKGLVMAGGTGLTTGILNTIENKVNKEDLSLIHIFVRRTFY